MRSPGKLVGSILCLGVLIAAPAALAQAIPKALIRLCLRNVATGIACYVIGRGGELIIDGSLSAAWAKTKETVTGEAGEDDGKTTRKVPPPARLPPSFKSPILEPIEPSELGSLSKRFSGLKLAPNERLTEGFFIYDAPKDASKDASRPLDPSKSLMPKSDVPKSGLAPPKSLLPEPGLPKLATPPYGDPYLSPDAYRARNAHKLVPPATSLTAGQFGTLQDACQSRRERETGLSLLAILGAPDFDAKFKRRINEVVVPCMNPRPF
jgi:hypothetical protein